MGTPYTVAVEKLAREFDLPLPDSVSQDWEWELPLDFRTLAQFRRYLAHLQDSRPLEERAVLMTLTLDAANTLAKEGELTSEDWGRVERELASDSVYAESIDYWADRGTPIEDSWAIAARMRRLRTASIPQKRRTRHRPR